MKSKKLISLLCVAAMTATMLTGCGGASDSASGTASSSGSSSYAPNTGYSGDRSAA